MEKFNIKSIAHKQLWWDLSSEERMKNWHFLEHFVIADELLQGYDWQNQYALHGLNFSLSLDLYKKLGSAAISGGLPHKECVEVIDWIMKNIDEIVSSYCKFNGRIKKASLRKIDEPWVVSMQ